jgi:hypothetical protein
VGVVEDGLGRIGLSLTAGVVLGRLVTDDADRMGLSLTGWLGWDCR